MQDLDSALLCGDEVLVVGLDGRADDDLGRRLADAGTVLRRNDDPLRLERAERVREVAVVG